MKKLIVVIPILIIVLSFVSCGNKKEEDEIKEDTTSAEEKPENRNTVMLTEQQMKTIGIELGSIEKKELTASLKANGVLRVPNQNKASINSVYSGVIKSLLVQPGNRVSKGQVIATIANPEFIQLEDDYLGVNSKIVLAEQGYRRQKELNAGNAGALKNLQAAEAELKTLRSRKSSLEEQLQLMGINPATLVSGSFVSVISIRSPISGVVSNVMVQIGSYLNASTTIAEIVDNSQLHLDLFVYEKDLSKLKNNQKIHFTVTNDPGKEYDALIYSLGSSFEGESKAVTVHATVQGDKTGLIDGMNVTAVISLGKDSMPAVPSDAIVNYQGQDYIFVQTSEKKENEQNEIIFERVQVVKGVSDVGYTQITLLKDITDNAKIVARGAFFVMAKMTNVGEEE